MTRDELERQLNYILELRGLCANDILPDIDAYLAAERERLAQAEAALERVRGLAQPSGATRLINSSDVIRAVEGNSDDS